MSEDASLDDFLGGESSEQSEAADDEPAGSESTDGGPPDTEQSDTKASETAAADEPAADTDDVEPTATTYAWSDEGTTCEACGETVERRWQQADGLVCIECKDWER